MRLSPFIICLTCAVSFGVTSSAAPPPSGVLRVPLSGFGSDRGQVVVKLFVEGDDVPKGRGTRRGVSSIQRRTAEVTFKNLPFGTYALFAFHDENENGTVDHNIFGLPKEPLGFSNGFRVTIFTGVPDFDDLKFRFDDRHPSESISLH